MAASEQFSDQIKKIQQGRSRNVIAALITQERTQKLDLLIHLITNLKKSLIICGPKGIGKSTLLSVFQKRTENTWPIINIAATEQLSFEKLQAQTLAKLSEFNLGHDNQTLDQLLNGLETSHQRAVLLIDDAGLLIPGLLTSIMHYATAFPSLRVVFSLNDDELTLKRETDASIDECHFIEIPPLSASQCGEFLSHLSSTSEIPGHENAALDTHQNYQFDTAIQEQLYKKTKGVPGKITAALPVLLKNTAEKKAHWLIALFGIAVIAAVGWVISNQPPTSPKSAEEVSLSTPIPLAIPGQTTPSPQTKDPATTSLPMATNQQNPSLNQLVLPEAIGKPDLYNGYGRTHEADALDTVEISDNAAIAEQLKVEIIPSEEISEATTVPDQPISDNEAPLPTPVKTAPKHETPTLATKAENLKNIQQNLAKKKLAAELDELKLAKEKATKAKKAPTLIAKSDPAKQLPTAVIDDDTWVLLDPIESNPSAPDVKSEAKTVSHEEQVAHQVDAVARENTLATTPIETTTAPAPTVAPTPPKASAPASNSLYTLQVIVFTQRELLDSFMQRHHALGSDLRSITTTKNGKERYSVFYGVFDTSAQANAAKQKLPAEFSHALARKL